MSKTIMSILLTLLFVCLAFFGLVESRLSVWGPCSSHNVYQITAKLSVEHFPRFAQNLMLSFCRIHREIASGQIHDS
jgi:hypothetical protein